MIQCIIKLIKQKMEQLKNLMKTKEFEMELDHIENADLVIIQDTVNNLILFSFNKTIKWIGFSVEDAKYIASILLEKIDYIERMENEKNNDISNLN